MSAGVERCSVFNHFWVFHRIYTLRQPDFIKKDGNGFFYESLWANGAILYCCCMISASAGPFARPSLLFHVDNCPHLNHRPTIGSNWHVALAVLGEIWECIRPRTGCPFHQLESCLLVGWGAGGGLPHCYLVSWSKWFVEILFLFTPLFLPACLSLATEVLLFVNC